jgi:malate dehydrogenase
MNSPIRIAISGAGGQIGYALVFRIAAGGLFGPDQPVCLSLLDLPEVEPRLRASQMELFDCGFPLLQDVRIGSDAAKAFEGADWLILLGSHLDPTHSTERLDLLRRNAPIYVEHGRAINSACPNARILVVANPCNTNCLIAKSHAPSVAEENWFAMTRLDRMRAISLVAQKAGVPVNRVTRISTWGNHGESIFVDMHNVMIDDRPAMEVIDDPAWPREVLEPTLARRSLEFLRVRQLTPAGSASQAIIGTIRSITTPTPHGQWFGAAVCSDGSYGVPRGLIFGFPLRTEDGQHWSIVQGLYHDDYALERIAANVVELEHEEAAVIELLGRAV